MNDPIVSFALQEWDRRINDKRFAISETSFELKQRWRNNFMALISWKRRLLCQEDQKQKLHRQNRFKIFMSSSFFK
jgi:hypothetical protein